MTVSDGAGGTYPFPKLPARYVLKKGCEDQRVVSGWGSKIQTRVLRLKYQHLVPFADKTVSPSDDFRTGAL